MIDIEHLEKMALAALTAHPGYDVLLKVMGKMCEVAETEHFQQDPSKVPAEMIAASHNTARAQRIFFERVQKQVQINVSEALAPELKALTDEEQDINQIVGYQ